MLDAQSVYGLARHEGRDGGRAERDVLAAADDYVDDAAQERAVQTVLKNSGISNNK